jgi:oxalate decarboxylase/phosphoglucose isomerase-like protein (cupin superfamily)
MRCNEATYPKGAEAAQPSRWIQVNCVLFVKSLTLFNSQKSFRLRYKCKFNICRLHPNQVAKPGFKSPWHYHPYTGVAYIIQGELTVNFDTNTSLTDSLQQKGTVSTQTYKAGDKAFLGVANTWHFSENLADKDLIFMVTWIGEKNKPIAVLE